MAYNKTFALTIADIDMIETALREKQRGLAERHHRATGGRDVAQADVGLADLDAQMSQIHELLGRLHNQKIFYRPRTGTYVSG